MTRQPTPDIFQDALAVSKALQDDVQLIMGDGATPVRRDGIQDVPVDLIDDNPFQPRQIYDPATLEELAASIERNGLQQPPAGRWVDGRMQLVFGHRRKRAFDVLRAKDPGRWSTMPVFVVKASDEEMAARAWTENVERDDLTALEQAQAIQTMVEKFGWTQAQVAERLGLSAAAVSNKLRLLRAPTEVTDAVRTGRMSERQAAALAPIWDLPEPALEAARNRQGYGGINDLIDEARRGRSSDELRQYTKRVIEYQTHDLDKPWVDVDLGHVAQVVTSRCTLCPLRILTAGQPRCAGQRSCYEAKGHAWEDQQRAALAKRAGVAAVPSIAGYVDYQSFYGQDAEIAKSQGLHQAPLCEHLRVRRGEATDNEYRRGLRLDGCADAELVCYHRGHGCACLEKAKRQMGKDSRAQWKLTRAQTVEALTTTLMSAPHDTLRLWASMHAPYDKVDQVVNWRIEDVVATIVKALMDKNKPYDAETKPDQSREAMEKMLRRGNIVAPWSLVSALVQAPIEPDSAARLRGNLHVLITWITTATSETPLATDLERIVDSSRAALAEIAGLPAGEERVELGALADIANQSGLEMLDLVMAGYEIGREVRSICNTPISDVNAKSALERATPDDLRWCVAVTRCQAEGKTRLNAIRSQLHKLETISKPQNGYIVPTVDHGAPDYIEYKLERISNWLADFTDPGDGLPTPESVDGNFSNLEKLRVAINNQQSEADAVKLTMLYDNVLTRLAALSDQVQQSYAQEN